jgi:hypothetical protein
MTAFLVKKPQLFYEDLYENLSCFRQQGRRVERATAMYDSLPCEKATAV